MGNEKYGMGNVEWGYKKPPKFSEGTIIRKRCFIIRYSIWHFFAIVYPIEPEQQSILILLLSENQDERCICT